MPKSLRFDNLPMDRRTAGVTRKLQPGGTPLTGPSGLSSVFEKRDVDPNAPLFARRTGTQRLTNDIPNIPGLHQATVNGGKLQVAHDFLTGGELASTAAGADARWTFICTIKVTAPTDTTQDTYYPIASFNGAHLYMKWDVSDTGNEMKLHCEDADGTHTNTISPDNNSASDAGEGNYHVAFARSAATSHKIACAKAESTTTSDFNFNVTTDAVFENTNGQLELLGLGRSGGPSAFNDSVVLANATLWKGALGKDDMQTLAGDTTPPTDGAGVASNPLLWHQIFKDGGDYHSHINTNADPDETYYDYLIPTTPFESDDQIHFAGRGIAELPFYTDFDDYYYTPQSSSARVEWHFYTKFTTPHRFIEPAASTDNAHVIFDFQDICKLSIRRIDNGSIQYRLTGAYANGGLLHDTTNLSPGTEYEVHVGRDEANYYIRLKGGSKLSDTANFPALYDYTTTLSYILGDNISQEAPLPFDGKITSIGFWNTSDDQIINPASSAVFYYDAASIYGTELRDRGNRALTAYLGTRLPYAPPTYKEGPIQEGSYVAATGGYYMTSFLPAPGYSGSVKTAITKDAVVQRIGNSAFLVSNGSIYFINDEDNTFRPLGVPRPSSKVSCNATGVGNIDGAVRYAYRYVTKEGNTGPPYPLDAVSSPGGQRVILGAQAYGLPGDSPFASSWLRCEGTDVGRGDGASGTDTNEWAAIYDTQNIAVTPARILYGDTNTYAPSGLTSEISFRLPNKGRVKERIFEQGVTQPTTADHEIIATMMNGHQLKGCFKEASEHTCMVAFKYDASKQQQTLAYVGPQESKYKTARTHYRGGPFHLSIGPSKVANFNWGSSDGGYEDGNRAITLCRSNNGRDNSYKATSWDYPFEDGHQYVVVCRKGRALATNNVGNDAIIHIWDEQYHESTDAKYGETNKNGWTKWAEIDGVASGTKNAISSGFWGSFSYTGNGGKPHVPMFGMSNYAGTGGLNCCRTYTRASPGAALTYGTGARNFKSDSDQKGVLYHARWWKTDFGPGEQALNVLNPGLDGQTGIFERYGCDVGTLTNSINMDIAFCVDAYQDQQSSAWCRVQGIKSVKFKHKFRGDQVLEALFEGSYQTPILNWGCDPIGMSNGTHDSEDVRESIPLGLWYSSRNEGSLICFTGDQLAVEIATKRWYSGDDESRKKTLLFEDFISSNGGPLNLANFTWVTFFFEHLASFDPGTSTNYIQAWLRRVYIDGTEVIELTSSAWNFNGMAANDVDPDDGNAADLTAQLMATLGGAVNMDSTETLDIAEFRLWDGDRYKSKNNGPGVNQFDYMGQRIPPTYWSDMWYYLRFAKDDGNNEDVSTTMDNKGQYSETGTGALGGGYRMKQGDSVQLGHGASLQDSGDIGSNGNTTTENFVPFPSANLQGIRGIQIYRTQVAPFSEIDPSTGDPTPSALEASIRAVRTAPFYYLDEIPLGTEFYEDNTPDALLGDALDTTKAETIPDPGGVVEWEGRIGVWSTSIPRIYWSRSGDYESFPTASRQDIALRESGPVTAAVELASRDARQSRVFVCGQSWAAFIDGNPTQPQMNSIGGGVGASTSRTLVTSNGIAYAYNGSLWAVTGDGQVADIGKPVQDLLPPTDNARLSISSVLASLFVIDERTETGTGDDTGLCLRFHFPSKEWFVEDRAAMSLTDIDGVDTWVHKSGWASQGSTNFGDDVESDTPTSVSVSSFNNATNTFVVSSTTGLKVGQRITLVGDRGDGSTTAKPDARVRQTITIQSINSVTTTITTSEDLDLDVSTGGLNYLYTAYPGIGYWGTMLDTGQFNFQGTLENIDVGIVSGDNWWSAFDSADFARKPTDRTGFDNAESFPTHIVDSVGSGTAGRWGLTNRQRIERIIIWANKPAAAELAEMELNYKNTAG